MWRPLLAIQLTHLDSMLLGLSSNWTSWSSKDSTICAHSKFLPHVLRPVLLTQNRGNRVAYFCLSVCLPIFDASSICQRGEYIAKSAYFWRIFGCVQRSSTLAYCRYNSTEKGIIKTLFNEIHTIYCDTTLEILRLLTMTNTELCRQVCRSRWSPLEQYQLLVPYHSLHRPLDV